MEPTTDLSSCHILGPVKTGAEVSRMSEIAAFQIKSELETFSCIRAQLRSPALSEAAAHVRARE